MLQWISKHIPGIGSIRCHLHEKALRLSGETWFRTEFDNFSELTKRSPKRFPMTWENRLPKLEDRTAQTPFDAHYIYHCAWAARVLARTRPAQHIDISSSLNFCTIVSAFIPTRFYDYRPADLHLSGLTSESADLMMLPFADNSVDSISCMHVVEHIGLGRYGDPLDPDGDIKAMKELQRVVSHGGSLLFVTPVGRPMLRFNAHRIYSYKEIIALFPELELIEFALVEDRHEGVGLVVGATQQVADAQEYGCGCFWFRRALSVKETNNG